MEVETELDRLLEEVDWDLSSAPVDHFVAIPQGSDDWYSLRKKYLKMTGSEMVAALGLDPMTSRQALWRNKALGIEKPVSSYVQTKLFDYGKEMEPKAFDMMKRGFVPNAFNALAFPELRETGTWLFEDDHTMASTPDGLVYLYGEMVGVLEIKCPYLKQLYPCMSNDKTVNKDGARAKEAHYVQMQMEMLATGTANALYAVYTPDVMAIGTVELDEELAKNLFRTVKSFKDHNVAKKIEPGRMNSKNKKMLFSMIAKSNKFVHLYHMKKAKEGKDYDFSMEQLF